MDTDQSQDGGTTPFVSIEGGVRREKCGNTDMRRTMAAGTNLEFFIFLTSSVNIRVGVLLLFLQPEREKYF